MDINMTLFGEMITFAILVWVTMKFIWPPIIKAMQERQEKIAEGLAAAERGEHQLKLAEQRTADMLREVKRDSAKIVEKTNARVSQMIDDAKQRGVQEGQRMIEVAKLEINQQTQLAKEALRIGFSDVVISATEKVLEKNLDKKAHEKMLNELISEI